MRLLILSSLVLISFHAFAQQPGMVNNWNLPKNIALAGYDAVAYHRDQKAVKGDPRIIAIHKGIKWLFHSEDNKAIFLKNPSVYEPAYGGWCAYAMGATGEKVEVDPATFSLINGRLYLFYNKYFNNTLNSWNKDPKNLQRKADMNWQKIIQSTKN